MKRKWMMLRTVLVCLCLAVLAALPAMAAEENALPRITAETTMTEVHTNPGLVGAGIMTYSKDKYFPQRQKWANKTLAEYVGSENAEASVNGLNLIIENYEAGVQVTYPLYTAEEIAEDATRKDAELYYFPGKTAGSKYAVVLSGNTGSRTAELKECVSTASELHEMGYTVFILRYRVFQEAKDNAPVEDLARAVQYITDHADQFAVQTEGYALLGYSSGGHLIGVFAGDEMGYKNYGLPKPGALILGYSIINFAEAKPGYAMLIDPGVVLSRRYYQLSVSDAVTDDYPPVYFWYGKNDMTLTILNFPLQGPALRHALQAHNVAYKEVVYDHASHGIGLGVGTEAEGWLSDAVAFWEAQTAEE